MLINITESAKNKLDLINLNSLYIDILKGGCFGYRYSLSEQDPKDLKNYILIETESIKIYVCNTMNIDVELTIDYISSIIKSGFEIKTNLSACCCNKSFGFKIDKNQCISS